MVAARPLAKATLSNFFGYGVSENAIPLSPLNSGQGSRYFV